MNTLATRCAAILLLALTAVSPAPARAAAEGVDFFEAQIRPLLAEQCYGCHSARAEKLKGGLRLDTRAGWAHGGNSGPAIVPGDVEASRLIRAVRYTDKELQMPPDGKKLSTEQVALLEQWVRLGAPDPRDDPTGGSAGGPTGTQLDKAREHWAYRPITLPPVPKVRDTRWPRSDLDRFVLARLEAAKLRPNGDADPRTLIRRMTYDLTGLPPTPEEVEAFVRECVGGGQGDNQTTRQGDKRTHPVAALSLSPSPIVSLSSPQAGQAVERLIDRLLASPHYGERWGRHWMDVVRYADTAGDNSDYPIPQAYLYRNYIIESFNRDKPFDQFIREQIAGDLLPAKNQAQRNEQIIATGYIAMSRRFGSVVDRYPHHLTIEDTLDNLGRTFLGLSLSCARCHDHKFDAVTMRDYYGLYGIFESTRYAFPGIELLKVQKDFVPLVPPEEYEAAMKPFREEQQRLQKQHDGLAAQRRELEAQKQKLDEQIKAAPEGERAALVAENERLLARIDDLRRKVRSAGEAIAAQGKKLPVFPTAYAVQDAGGRDATIQIRGEPDKPGAVVPRKFLDVLGGAALAPEHAKESGRRQLADWIADPRNPLTARVIVNRVWHHHFGAGLVRTPSDFGVRGQPPTHPELLDWLAQRFIADGWSFKSLHRMILRSRTYQMSSAEQPAALAADPENRLLWRHNRRRLDAESLRDTLLSVSGALDPTPLNEPHPFPPPEKWEFTQHHPFKDEYPSNRRGVYLMQKRLTAMPYFQTFDGADPNTSSPSRDASVTSVQALYLMNNAFVHEQAAKFAGRLLAWPGNDAERVKRAFELTLARPPTAQERAQSLAHLEKIRTHQQPVSSDRNPERDAWASLARVLFRLNEFLYLD
jgi:mono/diheme cytochrome c family protein